MENIKEKIRKLLSLAESPNENEAKAALLKARELMARNKLTEAELKDAGKQEVRKVTVDGLSCSKRRDPWMVPLAGTIAENYCCKALRSHKPGKQTMSMGFIGLEDDVAICEEVFRYAVDCVLAKCGQIRRSYSYCSSESVKRLCDSFGYGFVQGLQSAFREQAGQQENDWGLVLVTPAEVEEAIKSFGKEKFEARSQKHINGGAYHNGFQEGQNFRPGQRLEGEKEEKDDGNA